MDTASTKYGDIYSFPNTDAGLTANKNYTIITTKNAYLAYPVGSCITMSSNTNPSSLLGGGHLVVN